MSEPISEKELQAGAHVGPEFLASIDREFQAFDDLNPQVYNELVRLAKLWKERRGSARLGIATIYEVCRWNLALSTEGDRFKLNNNHRANYARKLMAHEPELAGFFFTRKYSDRCRCSKCKPRRDVERYPLAELVG